MSTISPELLVTLEKAMAFQRGGWKEVKDAARQYAQMKTFGTYEENGRVVTVNWNDRDNMTEHFKDKLLRETERAYAEDARLGATLAQITGA